MATRYRNDPRKTPLAERRILAFNADAFRRVVALIDDVFGKAGFMAHHKEALLWQIARETGGSFDPAQVELRPRTNSGAVRLNVGGFGFFMWTAGRADALVTAANRAKVDPTNLEFQIRFMYNEIVENQGRVWSDGGLSRFLEMTTAESASMQLIRGFFRPGNQTQSVANAGRNLLPSARLGNEYRVAWDSDVEGTGTTERVVRVAAQAADTAASLATSVPTQTALLQQYLNSVHDAGLDVDGIWGPLTARATRRYLGVRTLPKAVEEMLKRLTTRTA